MSNDLREQLAALSHEQWSGWMLYFFSKCRPNDDGSLTVPYDYYLALTRQATAPYEALSEAERDSDRAEADKVLAIVNTSIEHLQTIYENSAAYRIGSAIIQATPVPHSAPILTLVAAAVRYRDAVMAVDGIADAEQVLLAAIGQIERGQADG